MSNIIRFNPDDVFNTDSSEYEILIDGVSRIASVPGAVVEIGTRRGGSARMIIDALRNNMDTDRSMFCIDPYGNIEIDCTNINLTLAYGENVDGDPMSKELVKPKKFDYTNNMRNRVIPSLYYYAYASGLNFTFFCLEDTEFFSRYADGVPVYNEKKTLLNEYAFFFLDGPHNHDAVIREMEFFDARAPSGAVTVHDDIWMVDQDGFIEPWMFERGWKLLNKGQIKASYVKQ